MSAIILNSEIVHYEVLGRGQPIILLHSWVGSWRYWIPCMQSTSGYYRTYALDLWGYGDTAKHPSFYSLDQQISLLSLFVEKLGVRSFTLVGHGLGGIIALLYSIQNSGLVDRIMTIGLPTDISRVNTRLLSSPPEELIEKLIGKNLLPQESRNEANKADFRAMLTALDQTGKLNWIQLLQPFGKPCLWVIGQNDPTLTASRIEEKNELQNDVHQVIFEGSGHYPMLDEPSKFNRLLVDFMLLDPGQNPRQIQLKQEWRRRVR